MEASGLRFPPDWIDILASPRAASRTSRRSMMARSLSFSDRTFAHSTSRNAVRSFCVIATGKTTTLLPIGLARARSQWRRALNGREPLERIRKELHQVDQKRRLSIRFGASLFPIFQRAYIRAKVHGKQCSRHVEAFA